MKTNDTKVIQKFSEYVHLLKFSPYPTSSDLLSVITETHVYIYQLDQEKLEEYTTPATNDCDSSALTCIFQMDCDWPILKFSWCPETNLNSAPRVVRFYTTNNENKIKCHTTNLKSPPLESIIGEHVDWINDISCHPDSSNACLASVSQDRTCVVWSTEQPISLVHTFYLKTPGLFVSWHSAEPEKLMVAEKCGTIRLYSLLSKEAFMSLDCSSLPLVSVDWNKINSLNVAVLTTSELFLYDTSQSSQALEKKLLYVNGWGSIVKWSDNNEQLIATLDRPGKLLYVLSSKNNQVLLKCEQKICADFDWIPSTTSILLACDRELVIKDVQIK